jgi:hypothetical protein
MPHRSSHAVAVEQWLEDAGAELPAPKLIALLELALATLWTRANRTLGEITLGAIVDRVLHVTSERYPFLSISLCASDPVRFQVHPLGAVQHDKRLREVIAFVVAELIGVLGNLTDEILTPGLLEALDTVALATDEQRDDGDETGGTTP